MTHNLEPLPMGLDDAIASLLDGELSSIEVRRLSDRLEVDPAACDRLAEFAAQHAAIRLIYQSAA